MGIEAAFGPDRPSRRELLELSVQIHDSARTSGGTARSRAGNQPSQIAVAMATSRPAGLAGYGTVALAMRHHGFT